MLNNLLKSGHIIKNDQTRVIDSNVRIAEKIEYLKEIEASNGDGFDGFRAGLNVDRVEEYEDNYIGYEDGQYVDGEYNDELAGKLLEEQPEIDPALVDNMLAEAREEADRIISEANSSAEAILKDARNQAEELKKDAIIEGQNSGYDEGYSRGLAEADAIKAELENKEQQMYASYEEKLDELEPLFVDKITEIYEHVFGIGLENKKQIVLFLLHDAIRNIEGGKNFLVHVSEEYYEAVVSEREELTSFLPNSSTLEVIKDISLSDEECFIEVESGIFDCSLGTELELLKKELRLLSHT